MINLYRTRQHVIRKQNKGMYNLSKSHFLMFIYLFM